MLQRIITTGSRAEAATRGNLSSRNEQANAQLFAAKIGRDLFAGFLAAPFFLAGLDRKKKQPSSCINVLEPVRCVLPARRLSRGKSESQFSFSLHAHAATASNFARRRLGCILDAGRRGTCALFVIVERGMRVFAKCPISGFRKSPFRYVYFVIHGMNLRNRCPRTPKTVP